MEDRQSEESDDGTVTETGGETSEFEPSPVKHPRIESVCVSLCMIWFMLYKQVSSPVSTPQPFSRFVKKQQKL